MSKPNNQSNQQINTAALRGTREAHQPDEQQQIIKMTRDEWKKKHRDFKSIINGKKFVMAACGGRGTCLVPVEITQ